MKNKQKIVEKFFEDTGYCEACSEFSGVRKNYKKGHEWTFKKPSIMLKDFMKWLEKNH
jgi:hypothetical protein